MGLGLSPVPRRHPRRAAAFAGFPLPSPIVIVTLALGISLFPGVLSAGILTTVTIAAVALVAPFVVLLTVSVE